MYCKKCGKKIDDNSRFCSYCGARVEIDEEPEDEMPDFKKNFVKISSEELSKSKNEEKPKKTNYHVSGLNWDLDGFPDSKKRRTESTDFNWSSVVEKHRSSESGETDENITDDELFRAIKEDAKPARDNSTEFDWTLESERREDRTRRFDTETIFGEKQRANQKLAEEELERERRSLADAASETAKKNDEELKSAAETISNVSSQAKSSRQIDKFYTFNKKNEEFQALLDQEYERLRKQISEEAEAEKEIAEKEARLAEMEALGAKKREPAAETSNKSESSGGQEPEKAAGAETETETGTETEVETVAATDAATAAETETEPTVKTETDIQTDTQTAEEAAEPEAETSEPAAASVEPAAASLEPAGETVTEAESGAGTETKPESETETETAAETGNDADSEPKTAEAAESDASSSAAAAAAAAVTSAAAAVTSAEAAVSGNGAETESDKESDKEAEPAETAESLAETEPAQATEPEKETETASGPETEQNTEAEAETEKDAGEKGAKTETGVVELPPSGQAPSSDKLHYSDMFNDEDDEVETKKKGKGLLIFLDILIVIFAVLIVCTSIIFFAPDSKAADVLNKGIDKIVAVFTGEDTTTTVPDPVTPVEESEVEKAITEHGDAANIDSVTWNDQLIFDASVDYGIEGLGSAGNWTDSASFTAEDGTQITYTKAVVDSTINYFSALYDRMNNGTDSVLAYIDPDSTLYSQVSAIAPGENARTLSELQFGEILRNGNDFYVLVKISEQEAGKTDVSVSTKTVHLKAGDKMLVSEVVDAKTA
ncbi:MAG: zinc-ribbon domain-containing protein [Eubacterium sp.]|jgi:hypothetical protein